MLSRAVYGPLDRVRRVSRVMQGMIVIGAAVALLALLWAWLGPSVIEKDVLTGAGRAHLKGEGPAPLRVPGGDAPMADQAQLIGLIISALLMALVLYALIQAHPLF